MATLTLPDGTTIEFHAPSHIGREGFHPGGQSAVVVGQLVVTLPGRESVSCPIVWTNEDLRTIMMRCLCPEWEDPPDYSHCTPVEVRGRTIESFGMKIRQAMMSIDERLNG